jgi:hypothetical protein
MGSALRPRKAVDQIPAAAVGDQRVKGIFSERYSAYFQSDADSGPPWPAASGDTALPTTDAAWL